MRSRLVCLLLVAAFAAPLSAVASTDAHTPVPPKRLALLARDVPPGFHRVGASSVTDAQADRADGLPIGTFKRHGRIASYETLFRYAGKQFASIEDNVIAFKSSTGAHWEFKRSVKTDGLSAQGQTVKRVRITDIGDEAAGFFDERVVGTTFIACGVVVFRRGNYTAWVVTCSPLQTYSGRASPGLARLIDRRIRSATGGR